MSKLIRLACRATAVTAGIVFGLYKGVEEIRANRATMQAVMPNPAIVSEAAEALASITPLSPREVQDQLDAGLTVDEIKGLIKQRFGAWGAA